MANLFGAQTFFEISFRYSEVTCNNENYLDSFVDFRVIQPTLLLRKIELLQHMELMLCAHILGVLCHGTRPRRSSSAPATDPSTMTKEELSEGQLPW